jgi:hypothetical protein
VWSSEVIRRKRRALASACSASEPCKVWSLKVWAVATCRSRPSRGRGSDPQRHPGHHCFALPRGRILDTYARRIGQAPQTHGRDSRRFASQP